MPSQDQITNAKENFKNLYNLMDDLQLDFDQVMRNIIELLSSPSQNDPGQGIITEIIKGMFIVIGGLGTIAGFPAAAAIAGLGSLLFTDLTNNPPDDLNGALADYSTRFVRNIHHLQGLLADYAGDINGHWDDSFVNPADNNVYTVSVFGQKGFIPGKSSDLDHYNQYRTKMRFASDVASWKYFVPIVFKIAVRDDKNVNNIPGKDACHGCFASEDALRQDFHLNMNSPHSSDFFRLRSFSGNCSGSSDTLAAFDWWSLSANGNWASYDVCLYLFNDNGLGNTWNPEGLASRSDVFLNWGLTSYRIVDYPTYGLSCSVFLKSSQSSLNEANTALAPEDSKGLNLNDKIISFADFEGKNLNGALMTGATGHDVYARQASLNNANLSNAKLPGIDLRGASLVGANLTQTDLGAADLRNAKLAGADFTGAFLRGADFTGADITGANFADTDTRHAKGIEEFPSLTKIPLRYQPEKGDGLGAPVLKGQLFPDLAAVAGQQLPKGILSKLLSLLPEEVNYSVNYELPLQGLSDIASLIVRGTGEKAARAFAGLLETEGKESKGFLSSCALATWPAVGLRISLSGNNKMLDPFIDGPIGWQEVKAIMEQGNSVNKNAVQSVIDAVDNQSLYLWCGDPSESIDEISLRLRPRHMESLEKLAQMTGLTISAADPIYKLIQISKLPAIVFARAAGGKLAPGLTIYLPVSGPGLFVSYPFTDESKTRLKEIVAIQKTMPLRITAMRFQRTANPKGEVTENISVYI